MQKFLEFIEQMYINEEIELEAYLKIEMEVRNNFLPESEASRVIENKQGEKFCNCGYNFWYVKEMKTYCSKCDLPIDVCKIT